MTKLGGKQRYGAIILIAAGALASVILTLSQRWTEQRIAANRAYFGEFDPFGDFDLIFGASKLNLKTAEVPIRYAAREYGETQISRFRHGWLLLRMVVFAYRKLKAL